MDFFFVLVFVHLKSYTFNFDIALISRKKTFQNKKHFIKNNWKTICFKKKILCGNYVTSCQV